MAGSVKENWKLTTKSNTLANTIFIQIRFEWMGTNPENNCSSMLVVLQCNFQHLLRRRFTPESIETKCEINLVDGVIVGSHIIVKQNKRHFRC
jgi:osmotically inducible protein OsmC